MEVSEFMEIHEFSFADRKLQSGPISKQINIQHNLIPTQEPKETIDLVCTEINGKTPQVGFPRRSKGSGTPELLHIHPPQHPKSSGTSWAGLELMIPRQGWFVLLQVTLTKLCGSSRNFVLSPQSPLELCFPCPSQGRSFPSSRVSGEAQPWQEQYWLYQTLFFISLSNALIFFICLIPRRSCGTSFTFQGCLRSWNNSELWVFSWSWAGPASSMSPASAEDRGNVASLSLLGQLGA